MTTVATTRVDAKVRIDAVKVLERHRLSLGNIRALADSIDAVGLINPITLTSDCRLVAGQRRLEACRMLGWDVIPVRFADNLTDAILLLRAERDENTCREPMTPTELMALAQTLEALERPKAAARKAAHGGTAPGRPASDGGRSSTPGQLTGSVGDTRDVVAGALGLSGSTYKRMRNVHKATTDPDPKVAQVAQEAWQDLDAGRVVPFNADERVKAARQKRRPKSSVASKLDQIRAHAAAGMTQSQIATRMGLSRSWIWAICKENGIEIPADKVVGKTRRLDATTVVRETVTSLEALAMLAPLVDFGTLQTSDVDYWVASLTDSLKVINQLLRKLREAVR